MSEDEARRHRSARVILIDGAHRVLLWKSLDRPGMPEAGHRWHTPGGGVRDGETPAAAAARELSEETGLAVRPRDLGPKIAETSGYADLGWARGVFQDDFFHLGVTAHHVETGGQKAHETRYLAGHRWWPVGELAVTTETVHPLGLADLAADLAAGRVPLTPVVLPWHH
ncbi:MULTISPECIES: NUDIX hydrolase [Streptomyces]|jgi:8-oxo-dGTP pyrophosphatase MutT (NUDIX family)|uniref:NUDIX hydrolase n=1 Tax=Streptomyces TaxID=1883 RepID=UPI0019035349|nr:MULTISPECIES: NUDIX domain-containing protein [unclassified Streptomyces]MCU4748717.1 NUDIX domain-containing protein [Streptomyces sp. G-5]QQN80179.1 NUDIX domain-containing protein [Streptomyces sp. XC 2026]